MSKLLKQFYALITISLASFIIARLFDKSTTTLVIGIISTASAIGVLVVGVKLHKIKSNKSTIWGFVPFSFMGILGLPFSVLGIKMGRLLLKEGCNWAIIPILIFLYNIVVQIMAILILAKLFIKS